MNAERRVVQMNGGARKGISKKVNEMKHRGRVWVLKGK